MMYSMEQKKERQERGDLSGWAFLFIVVVFLLFAVFKTPDCGTSKFTSCSSVEGLEGGDIQKAMTTEQYR